MSQRIWIITAGGMIVGTIPSEESPPLQVPVPQCNIRSTEKANNTEESVLKDVVILLDIILSGVQPGLLQPFGFVNIVDILAWGFWEY
ncbi:MAG: hypothetical protein NTW32_21010 [Chloroflexi bacterium]|nr:hypothetical protein [Chloroflexota bacterium]